MNMSIGLLKNIPEHTQSALNLKKKNQFSKNICLLSASKMDIDQFGMN